MKKNGLSYRRIGWLAVLIAAIGLVMATPVDVDAASKRKKRGVGGSVTVKRGKRSPYVRGFRFELDLTGSRKGAGGRSVGVFKLTWKKRPFVDHEELTSDHLCLERYSHGFLMSAWNEAHDRAQPRLRIHLRKTAKKNKPIDEDKAIDVAIDFEIKDCQPVPVSAKAKEHQNPEMTGLKLAGVAWPEAVTPVVRAFIPRESVVDLDNVALDFEEGEHQQELTPTWTPESIEVKGKSPDPNKGDVMETLLFSWFSDAGEFKKQRSWDEIPENLFRGSDPDDAKGQTVRLWVVVRDGRGGTDWLERRLVVRNDAQTTKNPICHQDGDLPGCD